MTWPTKKLGEICNILDNLRKPVTKRDRKSGPYPYYGATGIQDYVNDFIFDEDLVLVGEDGAKWGTGDNSAYKISGKSWVNNHAHVLRPHRDILLDDWLVYFLNISDLSEYITGTTVKKLNQEKLRSIQIPLPPLEIQKKIVERVEKLMGKIDEAKNLRKEAMADALALIPSALNKIFEEGKKKGWEEKTIGEISEKTKRINPVNFFDKKFSYIDITSVSKSIDQVVRARILPVEKAPSRARNLVKEGDIIFATTRPYLKNIIMIPNNLSDSVASTGFCVIRSNKKMVDPSYVYYVVDSYYFLSKIIPLQKGATYPAVSDTDIYNQKIPLPPLSEQQKIVKYLDSLSEKVRKIQTIQLATEKELKLLEKSVLNRAFMV